MFLLKITVLVFCTTSILSSRDVEVKTEEDLGVKYANRCEVCKVLATELQSKLEETGKVHDVIEIGYSLDDVQPKKKTKYEKSELRLIESIDGVCDRILEYNIHKERQDSTRFAKGMSQTFKTLHGLVDKGVKVDLGIPYELWDKPSAEITHLKTQCESLLEDNEEAIEYWYWNLQGTKDLQNHLCTDHALRGTDNSCLYEDESLKGDNGKSVNSDKKEKPKSKDESAKRSDVKDKKKQKKSVKMDLEDGEGMLNDNNEEVQTSKTESKLENQNKRGEPGDSYWTEPAEYVKKQLRNEEKVQKASTEPEKHDTPLNNENVWLPEDSPTSEREEL